MEAWTGLILLRNYGAAAITLEPVPFEHSFSYNYKSKGAEFS